MHRTYQRTFKFPWNSDKTFCYSIHLCVSFGLGPFHQPEIAILRTQEKNNSNQKVNKIPEREITSSENMGINTSSKNVK